MDCRKCGRSNREIAKVCKWCGTPIARQLSGNNGGSSVNSGVLFPSLIDKDNIKRILQDIIQKACSMAQRNQKLKIKGRMELSFVITGDSGTGKTTVAKNIAQEFFNAGITESPTATIVNPVDYSNWVKTLDDNIKKIGNGVLIIEEAHKLVPEGEAADVAQIDYILQPMRGWKSDQTKPIVIFTGQKRLKNYFNSNPNSASAINYFLETSEISIDGLVAITKNILRDKQWILTDEAEQKLRRIFVNDKRNPDDALAVMGHNAAKRANDISLSAISNNITDNSIGANLVNGKEFIPKSFDEVMAEFDKYTGTEDIKKVLRSIGNKITAEREIKGTDARIKIEDHFQFLGNPGTGKTTMARLFANALNALGVLPIGQLVEVSRKDLISQYVGDTPKLVASRFDEAMGGVLFIDEAYSLMASENDSVGKEAVDTLLQLAENRRGEITVILAGYTKEMNEFMQVNSGLQSRFNRTVNFRDFTGPELAEIFRGMVSENGYTLSDEAKAQIDNIFEKMYLSRTATFGNAREVRNKFKRTIDSVSDRNAKSRENGTYNPSNEKLISLKDIEGEENKELTTDEILAKLDDIVGMESVKETLKAITKSIKIKKRRSLNGSGKATLDNIHIAITGNPGTGKTMIAKRLGELFKAMQVLPKGHVVERERKTLLDSYANSGGVNMDKAVNEAMGGILFIDEAYNLVPINGSGDKDKAGTEAIEALMTRMVNDGGKFITVIAGYKTEIEEFIENANPGLSSRFTHRIHIDDYTVDQLAEIFKQHVKKNNYHLTAAADELLYKKIEEMVTAKNKTFGNARTVIKLFNDTIERQAMRLDENASDEELNTIRECDIPYDPPKKIDITECMRELDQLVGLSSVKTAVRELADTIEIERRRAEASGEKANISLDHYLFLGNPGTGKTTVARIMGNIFYTLGLLPSNKVLEVTTKDLIAGYVGQTAKKTEQMINRAVGGIFFIDEAYGLNDGANGFGKDAMPVLLTKLLDYKGKMVSIAAGYPREMKQWINTNSGLESRYTRTIMFEDYTAPELSQIFKNIVKQNGLRLTHDAEEEMNRYFSILVYNKSANFANAREARNYFDRVKLNQGRRLRKEIDAPGFDKDELYILRRDDMIITQ